MRRISISVIVVGASIAVFGAAVFVVAFAAYALLSLNRTTDRVITVSAPSLAAVLSAKSNLNHASFLERNYLLEPTAVQQQKQQKAFASELAKLRDSLDFVARNGGAGEAAAVEETKASAARYEAAVGRIFERTATAGIAEGLSISKSDGARTYEDFKAKLARLREIVEERLESARSSSSALFDRTIMTLAVLAVFGTVLTVAIVVFIVTRVSRPLRQITRHVEALAAGDMQEIQAFARQDELGALSRSLVVFRQNAVKNATLEQEREQQQARVLQRQRLIETSIDQFSGSVQSLLQSLAEAFEDIRKNATSLSSTAKETTGRAEAVDAAAIRAASSINSVAVTAGEFSGLLISVGNEARKSAEIASGAAAQAEKTDSVVQGLVDTAQRIGKVTALIGDVASKTNLLALNATIESARAGEMGRGFAVVAGEVKTLATQTAKATQEIADQVDAIQKASLHSTSAIRTIKQTIGQINSAASTIARSVAEQGATAAEISRNTQQAAECAQLASSNVNAVRKAALATDGVSNNLLAAADVFERRTQALRAELEKFFDNLRAA
jgi:methyl-accepting chemotaxis protein